MNPLSSLLTQSPKAAVVVGKTVFLVGAVLIVAAMFGRVGMMMVNAERGLAKLPMAARLAEVYPQYPTWLVPEGPVGYTVAAILVLVGMYITVVASDALKRRDRLSGKF